LLPFVAALGGCGSTAVLVPPRGPNADAGLVHFIRNDYPPYLYACTVTLNGRAVATIANNEFVAVDVPPGRNHVLISISQGKDLAFDLEVEPNERHYIVLTGTVYARPYQVKIDWYAYAVTAAEGRRLMHDISRPVRSSTGASQLGIGPPKAGTAETSAASEDAKDAAEPLDAGATDPVHARLFTATASPAEPPELPGGGRPVWTLGLDLGMAGGGNDLIRATLTDGSVQTLAAGTGVSVYAYLAKAFALSPRHTLLAGVAGGLKGWNIGGDWTNYNVQLLRFPVIPFVRYVYGERPGFQPFVTAGLHSELGVHLSGSGAAADLQSDFDDAFGWMADAGLALGDAGGVTFGLRYTRLTYEGPDLLGPVNASSFGGFVSLQWTSLAPLR
jgi:hypothetical protein